MSETVRTVEFDPNSLSETEVRCFAVRGNIVEIDSDDAPKVIQLGLLIPPTNYKTVSELQEGIKLMKKGISRLQLPSWVGYDEQQDLLQSGYGPEDKQKEFTNEKGGFGIIDLKVLVK